MFNTLQGGLILALSLAAFVGALWALIDALRHPAGAYVAAGKQTKTLWGVILGVATLIAFVSLPWPLGGGGGILGLLGIAVIIAVVLYFVDVRPKLLSAGGGGGSGRGTGGW